MRGRLRVSFDGPVDSGAANAKQVRDLGSAVLPGLVQRHQAGFLAGVQLGRLTPHPTFRLGNLHAFTGA
jgi:hypothetical protein